MGMSRSSWGPASPREPKPVVAQTHYEGETCQAPAGVLSKWSLNRRTHKRLNWLCDLEVGPVICLTPLPLVRALQLAFGRNILYNHGVLPSPSRGAAP